LETFENAKKKTGADREALIRWVKEQLQEKDKQIASLSIKIRETKALQIKYKSKFDPLTTELEEKRTANASIVRESKQRDQPMLQILLR